MTKLKLLVAVVCLTSSIALAPTATEGQSNCNSTQDAAVQCFVASAVKTNLTALRYGMTLSQFQSYGVSVSKILQNSETYIMLTGVAAAIADAMPPTNANGSANSAAQDAAITSIVNAEVANGLVTIPAETTQQDLVWFTEDLADGMNQTSGIVMSPGLSLRILDSYITAATNNGTVNWNQVNSNITTLINTLQKAGLLRLPTGVTTAKMSAFAQAVAQAIYTYTTATSRASL
jgi:hypothetical protein